MAKTMKKPTKTKNTVSPTIKIDWDAIVKDEEFISGVSLLGAILVSKKRRPCVRQQVLNTIGALTTLLIAMDNKYTETLRLLDEDCLGGLATGQLVKPIQGKKRVRRG